MRAHFLCTELRLLLTAYSQLTGDIMQTNIEESDVPMVQVSEHWGARESHALWQGRIFTVEQFKAVCGYGEPSNPDHIYSYNCRHTHYPYWPGISEPIAYQREPGPFTVNGRRYTYYEATQKQRAMERQIRALKREVNAGGNPDLKSEIRQRTREYKAFSDACGIRPKLERLRVVGNGELMSPADLIRKAQMYVDDTFDDFSPLDLSKQERTALEKLHKLCQADGNESAIKIVNGEVGEVITSGAVGWVKTGENPPGTTLLHSHTNDTPFSAVDLRHLLNPNVEKIGVVSYNGDAWMAYVGGGWVPTVEEFDTALKSINSEIDRDVYAGYDGDTVSENDLLYMATASNSLECAGTLNGQRKEATCMSKEKDLWTDNMTVRTATALFIHILAVTPMEERQELLDRFAKRREELYQYELTELAGCLT